MRRRVLVTITVLAAVIGALLNIAGSADVSASVSAPGTASELRGVSDAEVRAAFAARPGLRARLAHLSAPTKRAPITTATGVSASAASSLSVADPAGDSASTSDITALGAHLTTSSLRLTIRVPGATNPRTDPKWVGPITGALFAIDAGADGSIERLAVIIPFGGRFFGVVVGNTATPNVLCAGNATFEAGGYLSVQVPAACVGSPTQIKFAAQFEYNFNPNTPSRQDFAPDGDAMAGPVTAESSVTAPASVAGGFVLDASATLWRVGVNGLPTMGIAYEYGSMQAPRGFSVTPDGGHAYVVSGSGRLFGIALSRNQLPPKVYGAKTWSGQDMARGVALRPNGSMGWVVDREGNLHPFGVGGKRTPPALFGVKTWPGQDMARAVVVMPDGGGGFTMDADGWLHWFSIGSPKPPPTTSLLAPETPASTAPAAGAENSSRSVVLLPIGTGGFTIDAHGSWNYFAINVAPSPGPRVTGAPSWPFSDMVRGAGVVPRLLTRAS